MSKKRKVVLVLGLCLAVIIVIGLVAWKLWGNPDNKPVVAKVTDTPAYQQLGAGWSLVGTDGAFYSINNTRTAAAGTLSSKVCLSGALSKLQIGDTVKFYLPKANQSSKSGEKHFDDCYSRQSKEHYYVRKL